MIRLLTVITTIVILFAGVSVAQDPPKNYPLYCVDVSAANGGWELTNNCLLTVDVAFTQPGGGLDDWFQMLPNAKRNKGVASSPYKTWVCKDPSYPYDPTTHKVPRYNATAIVCQGGNAGAAQ